MPGVSRAIDLLLLPLVNVINFLSGTKIRALFLVFSLFLQLFILTPLPFKRGVHIYAQTHPIQTLHKCSKLIDLYIDV
jgi:hypothetical protein